MEGMKRGYKIIIEKGRDEMRTEVWRDE